MTIFIKKNTKKIMENTSKSFKANSKKELLKVENQFLVKKEVDSYVFVEQDDQPFISNWDSLDLALQSIDNTTLSEEKLGEVVESLYIMLYDEVEAEKLKDADKEAQRQEKILNLISELKDRKKLLLKCDDYISDYLKSRMYSLLF